MAPEQQIQPKIGPEGVDATKGVARHRVGQAAGKRASPWLPQRRAHQRVQPAPPHFLKSGGPRNEEGAPIINLE